MSFSTVGRLALTALASLALLATTATATAADTTASERVRTETPVSAMHVYDGADPQATGCSANSTTVSQATRNGMTFQLRWSSSCQTNWVRILNYPGNVPVSQRDGLWMDVRDMDRPHGEAFTGSTNVSGTRWGNMVYSPGNNCAWGMFNYSNVFFDPNYGHYDLILRSSSC
ncbi:DUF2690 domain-containing protein [Nocardiopsis sp. CT-R113]|uniref:DUF2690 domain-containing protein n=1 Tax=Nocardiopsis codii TaxID=3065942 RepID=A0ABU7K7J8_9ACTN|nr:DUF2690 domain-containing protein [Nocardiopsis sp. CT-R113]MEE2037542.1 DUF2690 domain-containing protein [Nocardiopsis sp. CT-R113]